MEDEVTPEEQERRDRRWQLLQDRAPAGAGPIGLLGGMLLPSSEHTITEARRQRESGATLAASGRRIDLDLDKGTVTIHPPATDPD